MYAKNFTPLLCLRCTVLLQAHLGPACRSDHNEDNHLAANVTGNETSQKKKAIKHVRKQTCQNRQRRTQSCRPSCGHAGKRRLSLIPKQAGDTGRQPHLQFDTKTGRRTQDEFDTPSTPPSAICPTPATQNDGRCEFVPRLPRRTKVNVTKCHACHTECRGVTRDQGAPKPVQARHPVPSVPRLPRKTQ